MTRQPCDRFSPILLACLLMASAPLLANEMQVGRYTLRSATPTEAQTDLMAAMVTVRFSDRIQTLGEAVRYLLKESGYRLASPVALDPEAKALFRLPLPAVQRNLGPLTLPLPAVQRNLGPLTLRQALETLAGSAFRLVQDPVHRLVGFELCAKGWSRQVKPEAAFKQAHTAEDNSSVTEGGQ